MPRSAPTPVPTCTLEQYEASVTRAMGLVVGGADLTLALGYRTQEAFRKAHERGQLPVRTFEIDGRRGRFATTHDLAVWLWAKRRDGLPGKGGDAS